MIFSVCEKGGSPIVANDIKAQVPCLYVAEEKEEVDKVVSNTRGMCM